MKGSAYTAGPFACAEDRETMADKRIGIIGAGNFGSAVGHVIAGNGHQVILWDHFDDVIDAINQRHENPRFLQGVQLDHTLQATADLAQCADDRDLVFLAVPTPYVRDVLTRARPYLPPDTPLISFSKGVDTENNRPVGETVHQIAGDNPLGMVAGPAIADELARGLATTVILASQNAELAKDVVSVLSNDFLRVAVSDDVKGVEHGAILKNVYAIFVGYVLALTDEGRNITGACLAACANEMLAIGTALGARPDTLTGLAGLGDLVATGLSPNSHNHRFGKRLAEGGSVDDAQEKAGQLPEGARAAPSVCDWAREHDVDAPIARCVAKLTENDCPSLRDILQLLI